MNLYKRIYFFLLSLTVSVFFANFLLFFSVAKANISGVITTTVAVGVCGNNIVELGENCDRSSLDGQTCQSLGYDEGVLSCTVGCDFNVSECINSEPDKGSVIFSGKSYPLSVVKILKDGQIAATTAADINGNFQSTLSNLIIGSYSFAIYAYDTNNNKSKAVTYRKKITKDEIENISDILIPPTIDIDDDDVDIGDKIMFFGQSIPRSTLTIRIISDDDYWSYHVVAGNNDYSAYAWATINEMVSDNSTDVLFEIDQALSDSRDESSNDLATVDFNEDSRVNIIDFSMLLHWFNRTNFPSKIDINNDNKVNILDFSIMMYHWTG